MIIILCFFLLSGDMLAVACTRSLEFRVFVYLYSRWISGWPIYALVFYRAVRIIEDNYWLRVKIAVQVFKLCGTIYRRVFRSSLDDVYSVIPICIILCCLLTRHHNIIIIVYYYMHVAVVILFTTA